MFEREFGCVGEFGRDAKVLRGRVVQVAPVEVLVVALVRRDPCELRSRAKIVEEALADMFVVVDVGLRVEIERRRCWGWSVYERCRLRVPMKSGFLRGSGGFQDKRSSRRRLMRRRPSLVS
jgi:hypothetical protein